MCLKLVDVIFFRDVEKAKRAAKEIKEETGHDVIIEPLDLSDVESTKKFAKRCLEESRLDILVNNAGLMMPVKGMKTKQDFEVSPQIHRSTYFLMLTLIDSHGSQPPRPLPPDQYPVPPHGQVWDTVPPQQDCQCLIRRS